MADQQKADTPPAEGQGQQSRSGKSSSRGGSGAANTESAQSGSTSSSSGQSAQQSSDQERQRQISREPTSSGTGMQRGGQSGAGSAISGRGQPSMLPAFMTNPGLMASAFMSDPFAFAQAMSQEMDRLFDTFGGTSQGGRSVSTGGTGRSLQQQGSRAQSYWAPPMEVFQRGNEMVVRADLPGVTPDDVQIDVDDGVLTISGERRNTNEDQQEGFYRSERSYGAFSRSIALPEGVDENQVNARYEHGVLEVTVPLPQQQRQRGRRVQIQSGAGTGSSQHAGQSSGQQSSGQQSSGQQSSGQQSSSRQSAGQQGSEHHASGQSGAGGSSSTSSSTSK